MFESFFHGLKKKKNISFSVARVRCRLTEAAVRVRSPEGMQLSRQQNQLSRNQDAAGLKWDKSLTVGFSSKTES